ncbi:MAG TPA: phenylalanine--tRNA ligase beta subunit-related protein [Thermoanaerobaculia bacterium]|nr:phenylalanine--tRNA ligase beta subunit-related protein [Thermoanaerobaculia bacterium]
MTVLRVAPAIFEAFPEARIGVVAFEGARNDAEAPELVGLLGAESAEALRRLGATPVAEHPRVAPWREAYRRFGAKPKDHPSSIENLLRRVAKGPPPRPVNPLVDLYNVVSLRHFLPVGGEDLDAVSGDVELRFAREGEPAVRLLGEPEARPPRAGEVIYSDDLGALCRRWNWKEADRTKLTEKTTRGFLVVEALPPAGRAELDAALADLAALVEKYCGGMVRREVLDRDHPAMSLIV